MKWQAINSYSVNAPIVAFSAATFILQIQVLFIFLSIGGSSFIKLCVAIHILLSGLIFNQPIEHGGDHGELALVNEQTLL